MVLFWRRQRSGFVKGWFWRMYPRSGFRSGGTSECTLVPVFLFWGSMRTCPRSSFRSGGTSFWKPPFWKPPLWVPPNCPRSRFRTSSTVFGHFFVICSRFSFSGLSTDSPATVLTFSLGSYRILYSLMIASDCILFSKRAGNHRHLDRPFRGPFFTMPAVPKTALG